MKISKKLLAFALALLMMLSLCGCDLFGTLYPNYDTSIFEKAFNSDYDYRNDIVHFSEMEYVRPDVQEMQTLAAEISSMVDGNAARNEVTEKLNDFYKLYYNFHTMEAIAEIRSDIDVTDNFYFEEYSYCNSMDASVDRILDDMLCDCANSDICAYLDSQYFGGYLSEHYSVDGDFSYTDNLIALYSKESSLLSEYRSILTEMRAYEKNEAYRKYNESACKIYIELIKTRKAIAKELNYQNYEDYMFYSYSRDYTVSDLEDYLAAIKEYIVPLYKKAYNNGMMNEMYNGLSELNSDAAAEYLKGFASKMPEQINEAYDFMDKYGLYSIAVDENSSNISYTTYLDNYDSPFMLVKSEGYAEDLLTIVHEFGHFCDNYINYDGDENLDTTEVMSQGLEYMLLCYLDDANLSNALTRYKMLDELYLYVNQASFYEFEHRAFELSEAELTVDNINALFREIASEYGYRTDSLTDISWIDINHLFDFPFYVISYCVSDSAAFSLYNMELESHGKGLEMYVKLMNNADEYSFEDLLKKEGMQSPISRDVISEISDVLKERLGL